MNLINEVRGEIVETDEVMRQFDLLESKIEQMIEKCSTLEQDNAGLAKKISELEAVLEEKTETENRYSNERELVRSKIDQLLDRLNHASDSVSER